MRHLAAAELAHRKDRGLLTLDVPCCAAKRSADEIVHGIDDAFGDIGKGNAGLRGRHRAGQDAGADQEQAFLAEQPQTDQEIPRRSSHPAAYPPAATDNSC